MAYLVDITDAALDDAREYHQYILKRSHDRLPADDWFNGLITITDTLESLPASCPRIPEQEDFDFPLYQRLYASHRIIFRIDKQVVRILRVYPAAGRPLRSLTQRARHGKPG